MKKQILIFVLGAALGIGGMFLLSTRALLQIADMNNSMSLYQAVFSLEFYRDYGPDRMEWFLEKEVKCKAAAMRDARELWQADLVTSVVYDAELPITGKTVETAIELVGPKLSCEPEI